jgi:phosphoesterase RecJ-like protein
MERKTAKRLNEEIAAAAAELRKARSVLITGHVSPDGDCVGSCLAVALALRAMGKEAVVYSEDSVPYNFAFLPGAGTVVNKIPRVKSFDHTLILDLSEKSRVGARFPWNKAGFIINVDHHATGEGLGSIRVRDAGASATGELVYMLLKSLGAKFTPDMATNLYCAILTDTGSFHYSNSTRRAYDIAGRMVEAGALPWDVASRIYEAEPVERITLLGLALNTLTVSCSGRLATLAVTNEMYKKTCGTSDMTDQFVNYARSIRGVEVAIFLRELPDGSFKASMRSRGAVDVSAIGVRYGGGGHKNASGAVLPGPLASARRTLEKAVSEILGCTAS